MRTRTILTVVIETTDAPGYKMASEFAEDFRMAASLMERNQDQFGPGARVSHTISVVPLKDDETEQ